MKKIIIIALTTLFATCSSKTPQKTIEQNWPQYQKTISFNKFDRIYNHEDILHHFEAGYTVSSDKIDYYLNLQNPYVLEDKEKYEDPYAYKEFETTFISHLEYSDGVYTQWFYESTFYDDIKEFKTKNFSQITTQKRDKCTNTLLKVFENGTKNGFVQTSCMKNGKTTIEYSKIKDWTPDDVTNYEDYMFNLRVNSKFMKNLKIVQDKSYFVLKAPSVVGTEWNQIRTSILEWFENKNMITKRS